MEKACIYLVHECNPLDGIFAVEIPSEGREGGLLFATGEQMVVDVGCFNLRYADAFAVVGVIAVAE